MIAGGEEGGFEPVHIIQHQTENSSLLHHNPLTCSVCGEIRIHFKLQVSSKPGVSTGNLVNWIF